MSQELIWTLIAVAFASAVCGGIVGDRRNASPKGFLLGFFFGPIGVLTAFALEGRTQCAQCGGRLEQVGGRLPTVCPHCAGAIKPRIERI